MFSPIILILFLFAETVPSEPKPKNLHSIVPFGRVLICFFTGIDVFVTSSVIPTVK